MTAVCLNVSALFSVALLALVNGIVVFISARTGCAGCPTVGNFGNTPLGTWRGRERERRAAVVTGDHGSGSTSKPESTR
jgi:hypothetical protein